MCTLTMTKMAGSDKFKTRKTITLVRMYGLGHKVLIDPYAGTIQFRPAKMKAVPRIKYKNNFASLMKGDVDHKVKLTIA